MQGQWASAYVEGWKGSSGLNGGMSRKVKNTHKCLQINCKSRCEYASSDFRKFLLHCNNFDTLSTHNLFMLMQVPSSFSYVNRSINHGCNGVFNNLLTLYLAHDGMCF